MGQVLRCACTTEAVRRAIQHSQASLSKLASQYGINPKTAPSTVLTAAEEAAIVAFRKYTLLQLDDCHHH